MSEPTKHSRRRFAGAAAMTLAAGPFGMIGAESRLPVEGELPSLAGATGWLNSQPLTAGGLRGKVVLVDFCTYSCINWLRSLPYVRAWSERYRGHGLAVLGVHTPEFAFEKDAGNVREALKERQIDYPIALDNNYAIWRAFRNAYWPALYFVDAKGRIRHHRFGEGDYARSEMVIQQLLAEAGAASFSRGLVSVSPGGVEADADWANLKSPETYAGYERTENFTSRGLKYDKPRVYALPAILRLNQWAVSGEWTFHRHSTILNSSGGRISYRFHARDLHLVMAKATQEPSVPFRVLLDGRPPEDSRGVDVDDQGHGAVTVPRMYQLIRQRQAITDRTFEIEFLSPGAEVFSFTFG